MSVDENDAKNPARMPGYFGDKTSCALCDRFFVVGDMVAHDTGKDKLTCYIDPDQKAIGQRDCYEEWRNSHQNPRDAVIIKVFMGQRQPDDAPQKFIYTGSKIKCDQCGRSFVLGELMIQVNSEVEGFEPLIFCLSSTVRHSICLIKWVMRHGKGLIGTVVEFWGYQK